VTLTDNTSEAIVGAYVVKVSADDDSTMICDAAVTCGDVAKGSLIQAANLAGLVLSSFTFADSTAADVIEVNINTLSTMATNAILSDATLDTAIDLSSLTAEATITLKIKVSEVIGTILGIDLTDIDLFSLNIVDASVSADVPKEDANAATLTLINGSLANIDVSENETLGEALTSYFAVVETIANAILSDEVTGDTTDLVSVFSEEIAEITAVQAILATESVQILADVEQDTGVDISTIDIIDEVFGAAAPAGPPEPVYSDSVPDSVQVYKTIGDIELSVHIFYPEGHTSADSAASILFFHGGGLRVGDPRQGYDIADAFTPVGAVIISVQYRLLDSSADTLDQIIADAKSAVRWVRTNANDLGLDPDRIATMGHSAGAFLALATGTITEFDEPLENSLVSSVPNTMVLWSPTLARSDNGETSIVPEGYVMEDLTPATYLRDGLPQATFMVGTEDNIANPGDAVELFEAAYRAAGNISEFHLIEGADHFFFDPDHFAQMLVWAGDYLQIIGYTEAETP
jgi:acetyl esterase/lipase